MQVNYKNLNYIKDLEYFDGPLLMEFRDDQNNCYLFHWCDFEDCKNPEENLKLQTSPTYGKSIWCVYEITNENLQKYLNKEISMRDMYLNSKNDLIDIVMYDGNDFELKIQVSKEELLNNELYDGYLPSENAIYDDSLNPNLKIYN